MKCIFRCFACVLFILFTQLWSFGQGANLRSPFDAPTERDADHPQLREQWFLRGRLIPGQAAAALRYRAHLQKMQMRAARIAAAQQKPSNTVNATSNTTLGNWTPIGPAPLASDASGSGFQDYGWVSGRATAVAVDPSDSTGNTVYIAGAYGGVWKSTTAADPNPSAVTWTALTDDQATLSAGAIAIQPGNGNVVLVGTGEANSSADSYYGLGILRSADGGNSWTLFQTANGGQLGTLDFAGLAAARMAFSTTHTNTVVAAMATSSVGAVDGEITSSTQRGLYTSTDAGQSWTFNPLTDPGGAVSPATSANSAVYNASAGKFFAAIRYHGFYSSPDGLTWTRLSNQPGGSVLSTTACPPNYLTVTTPCPIYRGEIAVVPGRNEMYVWYVDLNATDKGIFRSTDGGASWSTISETGIPSCGDSFGCGTSQGSYNLELAAIPNGQATDLYAGAINIFKCTLATTSSSACMQSGGAWLNLTHVYGCSSIARVHPDQHDLDFIVTGGKEIMYFANDGGIYRALDGFTGLTTGTCGFTNAFDNLNQTLGSMTQFVSFSQHPTDPNTLLGGTQDNGSPATASSQSSTQWLNVNAGDGGFNLISPANPSSWFVSNPDVPPQGLFIDQCALGVNCHTGDFQSHSVVSSAQLQNDDGEFYFPYIFDPQNSSELIVGTCRIWRGPAAGGSYTALSGDFEPGGITPCKGSEINLVRSIDAGGAKDSSNLSKVMYAGTDGFGPGTTVPGGRIWVSTNAGGGTSTWVDRTGNTNPSSFPVSGIAVDPSDSTGSTAFATIMGFGVSHVWKTTNAGQSWTDFTGTLPDAPVNAVVLDATTSPSTVYAGTDVGVFASSTASASWTEVGPLSGSQTGFLPNVSVTALRIFNSGGNKKLRASTYGRGIWEFNLITTPDYVFNLPASQSIFPGQTATFLGTVTAINGYNSLVTLSCTGTSVPPTCTPFPTSLIPSSGQSNISVTASGPLGDYPFNLHAVGSDSNTTTHDVPLTLHVVDFNIGALSPSSVSVNRPNTSQPVTFQVTALGSFAATVTLSCSGLPSGGTCNFSPSSSVNPTSSNPVTVTMTVGTDVTTPPGTYPVTVAANSTGAPAPKSKTLSLTVTAFPDYGISVTSASLSAVAGTQATFNGTATAFNGYTSSIVLTCGSGAPPACTISPANIAPSTTGVPFTATVSSNVVQNYSFTLDATDAGSPPITHSIALTFNSTFDFAMTNNSSAQTIKAGSSATFNLDANPAGGAFLSPVTFACSGLPALSTCSFNPTQIAAGGGDTPVVMTVLTTAPVAFVPRRNAGVLFAMWLLPLPGLVFSFLPRAPRKRSLRLILLTVVLLLAGLEIACGGGGGGTSVGAGGQPGTPTGTYTITVTATSGGVSRNAQVSLTVQ